ncbi:MAG: winged helix-turn-helix domain-containing protein [Gammaproteobacteria bacterium]|nr:winged helix-turn-helix domain-containing protein [Gammaproteobacteria bacterium]
MARAMSVVMDPVKSPFNIGEWLIDPEVNSISRAGETHKIPPKYMHVLCYLAANPGVVVGTDDITDAVWDGNRFYVGSLRNAVWRLRKILRDPGDEPYIETIPRIGYRLRIAVSLPTQSTSEADAADTRPTLVKAEDSSAANQSRKHFLAKITLLAVSVLAMTAALFYFGKTFRGNNADTVAPQIAPLTGSPGKEMYPKVSPNGRYVAYARQYQLSDLGESTNVIELVDLEAGDQPVTLWTAEPWHTIGNLAWSPGGDSLAFTVMDMRIFNNCAIYSVSLFTKAVEKLADCNNFWSLDWSPDGRELVFVGCEDVSRRCGLMCYTRDDGSSRLLIEAKMLGTGSYQFATWSPDGEDIAFLYSRYEGEQIKIVSARGGEPQVVAADLINVRGLTWARDNESLIYAAWSPQDNRTVLQRVNIDSGDISSLGISSGVYGDLLFPALSMDGKKLSYVETVQSSDILSFDIASGPEQIAAPANPLIASNWLEHGAKISPGGDQIAYFVNRWDRRAVYIADRDGANARPVTFFDDMHLIRLAWSPDGRSIAAETRIAARDGKRRLYLIDVYNQGDKRILPVQEDLILSGWSHDGTHIEYSSYEHGEAEESGVMERRAWHVNVETGAFERMQRINLPVAIFYEGKNEGVFYSLWSNAEQLGIYEYDANTDTSELIIDGIMFEDWANWQVTDTGIYFITRRHGREFINFYDFGMKSAHVVRELAIQGELDNFAYGLSIAPDGKSLLFSNSQSPVWEVMLVNNMDEILGGQAD